MSWSDKIAMTRRQRIALLAVIFLIATAIAVRIIAVHLRGNEDEAVRQIDMQQVEQFRRDIDSAKIDSSKRQVRKAHRQSSSKRKGKGQAAPRPISTF